MLSAEIGDLQKLLCEGAKWFFLKVLFFPLYSIFFTMIKYLSGRSSAWNWARILLHIGSYLWAPAEKMYRSTKGASKARRDQINAEIHNLKDLLPISDSDKSRLSYLHIMSLACMYTRKSVFFSPGRLRILELRIFTDSNFEESSRNECREVRVDLAEGSWSLSVVLNILGAVLKTDRTKLLSDSKPWNVILK